METSEWRYCSSNKMRIYCCHPAEMKTRLFNLSAIPTGTHKICTLASKIKYLPYPPSPFSTYEYKILYHTIKYFPLSSKSSFLCTIPTRTHQVFFPVLEVFFPRTNPTRSHQVFFPLFEVFFLRTNPTRPHQVFSLSSKYFSYVQILPDHIRYFSLYVKYFSLSSKSFFYV